MATEQQLWAKINASVEKLIKRQEALEPLFYEINRRAYKEDADGIRPGGGRDFTVTITSEMWEQIKDHI